MARIFVTLLLAGIGLFAQSDTASLSGTVIDPSGAAVAGARITLQNLSTGSRRMVATGIEGTYHFSLLVPGSYEIQIEALGFKQYRDDRLVLRVAQAARLNATLEIGSPTESVTVENVVSVLATDSVAQDTIVSEEKIQSLPLNGRQFVQLTMLVPGANAGGRAVQQNLNRQGLVGGVSVAGNRTNNTVFLLDGAANVDPDYNALSYIPSIDTIREFQVQTAMAGAEYGRASGGYVNVVTKSGSNEFHGSAWEFLRNDRLDARPFNLPTPTLPKFRRNQFGGTLGAPLVPNKLFAFLSFEGLRIRQAGAGLTTVSVPSALKRAGDFSETPGGIFDPATLSGGVRQPFPENRIPADRLNGMTVAAANALPLPNMPGTSLFVNSSGVLVQQNENYSGRIDYNAGRNVSTFGRFSIANEKAMIPATVTGRDGINKVRPQNSVAGVTILFRPDLVSETRVAYNRYRQIIGLPELSFNVNGQPTVLPQFLVAGYPTMGGAGQFVGTTGGGVVQVRDNTYQVYDNVTWQIGRHSVKFGGEALQLRYNRYEAPSQLGVFQFTNGFTTRTAKNDGTGDSLASALLGLPAIANRTVGPNRMDGRQPFYSAYVQDNFRIAPALNLNLGVRYEYAPPMYDVRSQLASIDYRNVPSPGDIFAEGRTGYYMPTLVVCGQGGYPRGCAYTDKNNVAPRAGLVWSATEKTVLRAGAGVFYAATDANPLFRLAAGLPANISQTLNSDNYIPRFQDLNVFSPPVVGAGQVQAAGIDIDQRTSYSLQWNFTIQRELRSDMVLEVGYLATLGLKLEQNVQPNNAQPGSGAVDPRRPYAGMVFGPGVTFPDYLEVAGTSVPVGFINYLPHAAQSNYHAAVLRLEKQFGSGLSWLTSYTFSKAISNAPQFRNAGGVNGAENSPPQDSFNIRAERGLAYYDARHRVVNTWVFDLPFGRGKPYVGSGVGAAVLGGWQASGIVTFQSGFPFTVNLRGDTAGVGAGTGGIFVRPMAAPGAKAALPASQSSAARFFNTSAFLTPAAGTFGNVGRNTVIGPGLSNVDFVLARSFRLTEHATVQFRGEVFNAANRPNYNVIGRILNDATFGRALSQLDPRQLQFGLKVTF